MKEKIDPIVRALHAHPDKTGVAVGVVRHGQSAVWGYGHTRAGRAVPPGGDTVFEIGSLTKVFTAALLAVAAAEGRLGPDDPVCRMRPELSHLPPEITPARLAAHTAWLPRMPSNMWRSMLRDRRNPHAAYTAADLFGFLAGFQPKTKPGERVEYSNVGAALLGHLVARALGQSYEAAVVSRICDPLGMSDTRISLTADQKARLAPPRTARGAPGHTWDLPAFEGAGALRSTADDMLKFLTAALTGAARELKGALQACHVVQPGTFAPPGWLQRQASARLYQEADSGRYRQNMAWAWHIGRLRSGGSALYWHQGATGGYNTFAGFVKSAGLGVVVLCNRGPGGLEFMANRASAGEIGFRILERLVVE